MTLSMSDLGSCGHRETQTDPLLYGFSLPPNYNSRKLLYLASLALNSLNIYRALINRMLLLFFYISFKIVGVLARVSYRIEYARSTV